MDLVEFKQFQRQAWEAGDYRQVGRLLDHAARRLVDAAGVAPGQRVLDVGAGSGSVAIAAAKAGAEVVGVDLTDAWFDEARRRAEDAGVEVTLQLGDAEELPVDDAAVDVVLSGFGAIFAPRHGVVAAELARVCQPGGIVAFTAWPPDSAGGRMFAVLNDYLPEPPDFVESALRWGDAEYARERFAAHQVVLDVEHAALTVEFPSIEVLEAFMLSNSGPLVAVRQTLAQLGRWDDALGAVREEMRAANEADDGTYRATWDYLIAVGTKTA